jgi:hypothetical protein
MGHKWVISPAARPDERDIAGPGAWRTPPDVNAALVRARSSAPQADSCPLLRRFG